ncbi:MAG TPA: TetR/AcrR family transcriptional regulator [Acidimicrobiales bacterium]|nr:TetR/AcrR family transcriptional regulator [Acidimicrobiales bacterium]
MSKRQRTGEQLLVAARQVFEERGYQGASVGAITEAANMSHGTFYLYFRNKEDAFANVMADVAGDIHRQAEEPWSGDLASTVRRAVTGAFGVFAAHKGLWRCLLEGMHSSAALERMWTDLRRPFIQRVERLLALLVERGEVRALDPSSTAYALVAMVEWSAIAHVEFGEPPSGEALAETLADLWLHAVYGGATLAGCVPTPAAS